jgi:putative ABC transport system ATP-binding protein
MLLKAKHLTKHYGAGDHTVCALRDASFSVEPGEFVAIMGPSGSGKSTLMSLIGLLDRPSSGKLVFAGEDTTKLSPDRLADLRNREIGFIFQAYNLLARNTALENVEVPLAYARMPRRERLARAKELLSAVGLGHRCGHSPAMLSGGEQQRVAIARALACNPAIILADEPTGALDSRTGQEVLALMQALNRLGRTIIIVTHDENVAAHAGRIIRLRDGAIVRDDANPVPADAMHPRGAAGEVLAPEQEVSAA